MLIALLIAAALRSQPADPLAAAFKNPPPSARPYTWWHWMNGEVTKEGITADLEAMKQVGIGGAQMFTVDQNTPAGPAKYGGPKWRELTAFAVKEAKRLGLELTLHNGAGWSSSGGPWVTPEQGMQVIGWSETKVTGPGIFARKLPDIKAPRVDAEVPLKRDIAVYAYPTPAEGDTAPRPRDFLARTGVERGDGLQPDLTPAPAGIEIPQSKQVMLTKEMDSSGNLIWQVPAGNWTILRMGYVPTGIHNHPAPPEGDGLEVDKLSKSALDNHWANLMGKVIRDVGPNGIKTLRGVLIDSYEVGSQNWSPAFRSDFQRLRGYDPLPWLPVVAGRVIDSKEKSERFLWDLRRTIADLYAENYYGHMAELAHRNGMIFYSEPYGNGGFDNMQSGSKEDVPMAEFWIGSGAAIETTKLASSIGHTNGRPIIGAESFTGDVAPTRWKEEPYDMKALGDLAFVNGINRYIFHRYAMQPWLNLKPGMTMGPWGTHLERTQTWWTEAASWMKYIARCQYLLQHGQFRADICYFNGEEGPSDLPYRSALDPAPPEGYDYDGCDTASLMQMSVKNGKLVLPSGMSYRLLVLPKTTFMTAKVAGKLKELVAAGATIYGPAPVQSPSLSDFSSGDARVKTISSELWGDDRSQRGLDHAFGKGRVEFGQSLLSVLKSDLKLPLDFDYSHATGTKLAYIHRRLDGAEVYFVSNQHNRATSATCTFRVKGVVPELWNAQTGTVEDAPVYSVTSSGVKVPLQFDTAESVFVVFRKPLPSSHLSSVSVQSLAGPSTHVPVVAIDRAFYGSAAGQGIDVTAKVRAILRSGETEIPASNGLYGDPAVNVIKQLVIDYRSDGVAKTATAPENGTVSLLAGLPSSLGPKSYGLKYVKGEGVEVTAWRPTSFSFTSSSGVKRSVDLTTSIKPLPISGAWKVSFPPHLGAPSSAVFDKLISWPSSKVDGIKYFSGSATYTKDFTLPASMVSSGTALRLNLGQVKNFATVTLNGKQIAVVWKPPFALDVSGYVKPGVNHLSIKVTNLWPNRIIGDEQLPPDVEWDHDHLARWPDWLVQGKPRPKTGRVTFETWKFYDKNSPLLESGLLGPVVLEAAKKVIIKP